MPKSNLLAAVTIAALSIPAISSATPISGLVYEKGPNSLASVEGSFGVDLSGAAVYNDFSESPLNPDFDVEGDTSIFGSVLHKNDEFYTDQWTMDFGANTFNAVFSWFGFDGFAGEMQGVSVSGDGLNSISLGNLTGEVVFVLDAKFGTVGSDANWNLELSQVPVPAGGLLLLSGLAGLGFARRKMS